MYMITCCEFPAVYKKVIVPD